MSRLNMLHHCLSLTLRCSTPKDPKSWLKGWKLFIGHNNSVPTNEFTIKKSLVSPPFCNVQQMNGSRHWASVGADHPRRKHSQTLYISGETGQPLLSSCQRGLSQSLIYSLDPATDLKEGQRNTHGEWCREYSISKVQSVDSLQVTELGFFNWQINCQEK